ncbi:hypothetical protein AB7M47_004327 [Bradyrhizobium elkanii]
MPRLKVLMWQLILEEVARELERRAAQWAGRKVFRKTVDGGEPNKPEAYADRINREFGLRDYFKAWNLYDSDRAYWEELFGNDPLNSPDHPASPPGSLLPRADAPRNPRYDYLNPAPRAAGAFGRFGTGGQFSAGSAISSQPLYETRSFVGPPDGSPQESDSNGAPVRRLVRVPTAGESQARFDGGAPAVPFVPRATKPGRPATFSERFGGFASPMAEPRAPIDGQPMPSPPLPPSVFRFLDNSDIPEMDFNNWLASLIRPRARQ